VAADTLAAAEVAAITNLAILKAAPTPQPLKGIVIGITINNNRQMAALSIKMAAPPTMDTVREKTTQKPSILMHTTNRDTRAEVVAIKKLIILRGTPIPTKVKAALIPNHRLIKLASRKTKDIFHLRKQVPLLTLLKIIIPRKIIIMRKSSSSTSALATNPHSSPNPKVTKLKKQLSKTVKTIIMPRRRTMTKIIRAAN
jgi:hypothetical protein